MPGSATTAKIRDQGRGQRLTGHRIGRERLHDHRGLCRMEHTREQSGARTQAMRGRKG